MAMLLATEANAEDWVRKPVGNTWTWFEDYVRAYATYSVACEPGRECQVGMGIFAFGEPRGEKIHFTGEIDIAVIGAGSIHIRVTDGKGPARAAIFPKDARDITTPSIKW